MNDHELQQALRTTIDAAAAPVPAGEARLRAGDRRRGLLALTFPPSLLPAVRRHDERPG